MKNSLLILAFAVATIGEALAQAPASVAGLTYRGPINPGSLRATYFGTIDLLTNGTYVARIAIASNYNTAFGQYGAGLGNPWTVGGSYTYTTVSANQATLTFPGFGASFTLTFSDGSNGTAVSTPNPFQSGPFSLTPSGVRMNSSSGALVNISTMLTCRQGQLSTIGFVVGGTQMREILLRVVGPSLAQFGITTFASNPVYVLNGGPTYGSPSPYYGQGGLLMPGETAGSQTGVGWSATTVSSATISGENTAAGAFPLLNGSNDKADVFIVSPGAYTITVNPTDLSGEGIALIEVYEVP